MVEPEISCVSHISPNFFTNPRLPIYSFLAKRRWPKSYVGKIKLIAFFGTHLPVLALFFYVTYSTNFSTSAKVVLLLVALAATLMGTLITLFALNQLLSPIKLTFHSLRRYLEKSILPELPTGFTDEVGVLMADTMHVITRLDESVLYLKNYDLLTALPNRALFQNRLDQVLSLVKQDQGTPGVILLNIDDFSTINNSLGFETGNLLLRQTAQRLQTCVRENDMLSRIGNDEFAVLYTDLHSPQEIEVYSQCMLDALAKPMCVDGQEIYVSASIGIALYTNADGTSSTQLLENADVAVRHAKENNRNTFRYYASEMNEALLYRLALERDLRCALEREELHLYYQPQIDSHSGSVIGAEALLRWRHPQRGMVSPAEFIPVAEASGLMLSIGDWVLRTACRQGMAWQQAGYNPLPIAVNLSASQFREPGLVERITMILQETGQKAELLGLEITESLLMEDVKRAILMLQQLHDLGFTLALDDFGTGYSSLNYLKRFPLDMLKIDQSFVRGLPDDVHDCAITQAVITLAQSLDLLVIAEGVETDAQKECLKLAGCLKMQGYYFGYPVAAPEFTQLWQHSQ